MSQYTPKKLSFLRLLAMCFRGLAQLLAVWPLVLIAAFFLFPNNWHMRVHYVYEQRGYVRMMIDCTYLGNRGFTGYVRDDGECPFITEINYR